MGQLTTEAKAAFGQLASKLDLKDLKTGKTLLDHLTELVDRGVDAAMRAVGITTGSVVSQLVQQLASPGRIRQDNRGTCAPTTAEYYMATQQPAEYARLAAGLMMGDRVQMASGATLVRDPGSVARDNSQRSDIDRIFQVALMDRSELGDYDNRTDAHVTGAGGATQDDVTRWMNDLTAGREGTFRTTNFTDPQMMAKLQASLQRGVEVPVGLNWSQYGRDAGHELLVTKIENGQVYLRNPWGVQETGSPGSGPNRRVLDNQGDIVMSLAEFQSRLAFASVV